MIIPSRCSLTPGGQTGFSKARLTTTRWPCGLFFVGIAHMEPQSTDPPRPEHPQHTERPPAHHTAHPHHHVQPIDPGYRLVVRIALWVIAGTVLVALCVWWART